MRTGPETRSISDTANALAELTGASSQLALFSSQDEAQMYHDRARAGFFSLLVDSRGEKRQSSHRLADMPKVLNLLDKKRDTWMSQAEFIRPNRRVVNLLRLGLLFADLDTYRVPALAGRAPDQLVASVLYSAPKRACRRRPC